MIKGRSRITSVRLFCIIGFALLHLGHPYKGVAQVAQWRKNWCDALRRSTLQGGANTVTMGVSGHPHTSFCATFFKSWRKSPFQPLALGDFVNFHTADLSFSHVRHFFSNHHEWP